MEKILLINLKKFGDTFQSAHLINTIKTLNPDTQVDVLCFEESAKAAKTLRGVGNIFTINRKKIISFYKNNIYSDGLAFNAFHEALEDVIRSDYRRVINYSNDKVSTYISSYLSNSMEAEVFGIRFDSKNSVVYSDPFSIILNDVNTTTHFTPFNFNDTYHYICGVEGHQNSQLKIKSNSSHDQTAVENFDRLRATKQDRSEDVNIVGIQISSASATKDIPKKVLIETIQLFIDSDNIVPILLNAPLDEERELIKEINSNFDHKLVSVEADFIALPSVLKGINLLLTPDTSVKHVADLVGTPCLEVSLGEAPFLKQGSINPKSAIISRAANLRVFKEGIEDRDSVIEQNSALRPALIYHTTQALIGSEQNLDLDVELDSEFCVYRPKKVQTGTLFVPISGPFKPEFEIRRLLARPLSLKLAGREKTQDQSIEEVYQTIYERFDRRTISKVVNEEKHALSDLTKDLLSTLRGLIQTQEDRRKATYFVEALEKLISRCFDNSLSAFPTLFFRARLESLNATSLEENFKEVEGLLYDLKSNLQNCFNILKEVEDFKNKDMESSTNISPRASL